MRDEDFNRLITWQIALSELINTYAVIINKEKINGFKSRPISLNEAPLIIPIMEERVNEQKNIANTIRT